MPKVTREDIPNWFQKKTGFDVDIEELKKAAELDRIAEAFLFPASLGAPPPAASENLEARLADLRRASRAKRCNSDWKQDTATA